VAQDFPTAPWQSTLLPLIGSSRIMMARPQLVLGGPWMTASLGALALSFFDFPVYNPVNGCFVLPVGLWLGRVEGWAMNRRRFPNYVAPAVLLVVLAVVSPGHSVLEGETDFKFGTPKVTLFSGEVTKSESGRYRNASWDFPPIPNAKEQTELGSTRVGNSITDWNSKVWRVPPPHPQGLYPWGLR
jgi:hypothetical protein